MPCNSDYMQANNYEVSVSRVACLLNEVNGSVWEPRWWDGYHPLVYGKPDLRALGDELTARLCKKLRKLDVTKYSLEMQMWWRDHQAADEKRNQAEERNRRRIDLAKAALKKLSPEEIEAIKCTKL